MDQSAGAIFAVGFFEVEGLGDRAIDVVGLHIARAGGIDIGTDMFLWRSLFAGALVFLRDSYLEGFRHRVGGEGTYDSRWAGFAGFGRGRRAGLIAFFSRLGRDFCLAGLSYWGGFAFGRGRLGRGGFGCGGFCGSRFRFGLAWQGRGRGDGLGSGLLRLLLCHRGGGFRRFGRLGFFRLRGWGRC
jgi:hypothetical protein